MSMNLDKTVLDGVHAYTNVYLYKKGHVLCSGFCFNDKNDSKVRKLVQDIFQ